MDLYETHTLERPRKRRLTLVIAVVAAAVALVGIPALLLSGVSAWFMRAYVSPLVVSIEETLMPKAQEPASAQTVAETTGIAAAPVAAAAPESEPLPLPMMASLAAAPPLVSTWSQLPSVDALADVVESGEPIAGPVPLPRPRPRSTP